jgi:hypothetical protein
LAVGPALMFASSGDIRTAVTFVSLGGVPAVAIIHSLNC